MTQQEADDTFKRLRAECWIATFAATRGIGGSLKICADLADEAVEMFADRFHEEYLSE